MAPAAEDDPFEDVRDQASNPMRRLFVGYGRAYVPYFLIGVLTSMVARVLDLLPPVLLGIAIDSVFREDVPFDARIPFSWLPEAWVPATQTGKFWFTAGVIGLSFLGAAGFHWTRNWGWNAFAQKIQHDVRTDTYDEMQRLDMGFFADKQTGELMSILSNDVNQLERFLNEGMNSALRMGVMVLAIGGVLFSLNWQLALVALLPVPLIAGFTYIFVGIIQPKYAAVRSSVGTLNSRLENNLGGISVIKSANTEPYESERVEDVSFSYFDANWDAIRTRITFFPALRVLAGIGFVTTFTVGGLWVFRGTAPGPFTGTLETGAFVTFILLTQQFIWPMAQFGQIINMYQRARASAERIFGLMDEPNRIAEAPDAQELTVTEGEVVFDSVTFGYEAEPIVEDLSFRAESGDTLALVGPTGAGKSTALKLLLRMYDVDEGAIRIDGQDIRDVTIASLREQIGYVSQDTFLFFGTVAENIGYGVPDPEDEAVIEAAKAAHAHEFITELPEGYDTKVGERGVKLSGGQRQRIAIARAILADPEILILDEATSDVDTETEMLIQRSLQALTADRTTFAIAHRLSTVKDAETIVVLDEGRVVEQGTHEDLLAEGGLYANLWGVQAGEIEDLPETFVERARERLADVPAED
ncbi:ABC transporter ATP-binding protein [Halodesulfurarchaeum formicicum]|uniref:Multidrug ABC transporter ATP-binding protein n=1 Tax=Halodesulfurarchaeum formicicum TaxID=1873524 RepID=A0A1J1AEY7_9EURY|nr:ABC transporter ATP-binding protein [Halodesulfurarchaeum formicicum]APE96271.1 multidrug ABC transporter ATP-binding protein [Halodesulfurarchaeum formicicum]